MEKCSQSINTLGNESYNLGIALISRNAEDGLSHKYFILFLKKHTHRESSEANVAKCYHLLSLGGGAYECHFNFCVFELFHTFRIFF